MTNEDLSIRLVGDFVKTQPRQNFHIRLHGNHMHPYLKEGELLTLAPALGTELQESDVVLAHTDEGLHVYRILMRRGDYFLLKGDGLKTPAPPVEIGQIVGKVIAHGDYPKLRGWWSRRKAMLTRWLSFQLCEMILENQSREI